MSLNRFMVHRRRQSAAALFLALALALSGMLLLGAPASAAEDAPGNTLTRQLEPVIVKGSQVPDFAARATGEIWVYAWKGNAWVQIPSQVDEVNSSGAYVANEDGVLDDNDEIVFMAVDAGSTPPAGETLDKAVPAGTFWYEIRIANPLAPAEEARAYIVHSSGIAKTFTEDYVDFAPLTHRLRGQNYTIGYATPNVYADFLTLGTSTTDILDRNKLRIDCEPQLVCPVDEEASFLSVQDGLITDGAVRTIFRNGRVVAYGSMLSWSNTFTVPTTPINLTGDLQVSLDFLPAISGASFYNAAVPSGVVVDGQPDTVPEQPFSPWVQLSTDFGTLIQVVDADSLTGTPRNFYVDDNTFQPVQDTGDGRNWGEAGIFLDDPGNLIRYDFNLYILAGKQQNRGEEFTNYYNQPLTLQATKITTGGGGDVRLFVPAVRRVQ